MFTDSFFSFWCLILFIFYSKNLILTGYRLRYRSSQRGQTLSFGNLFLAFFFGLVRCIGQKFSMFWRLFLFFLACSFFRAVRWRLYCRTRGGTKCWILGTLVLGFLPLFRGFLTAYWLGIIFFRGRSKSLHILLVLLGPRREGTVVTVGPVMTFPPIYFLMTKLTTLKLASTVQPPNRFALSFSSPPGL